MTIKRLSPSAQNLPSQTVEELRRSRRLHDLNVVVGRQFEKPLQASAGMFGSQSFESVRQQKRDTA